MVTGVCSLHLVLLLLLLLLEVGSGGRGCLAQTEELAKKRAKALRQAAVQNEVDRGVERYEAVGDVVHAEYDVDLELVCLLLERKDRLVDEQERARQLRHEEDERGDHEQNGRLVLVTAAAAAAASSSTIWLVGPESGPLLMCSYDETLFARRRGQLRRRAGDRHLSLDVRK